MAPASGNVSRPGRALAVLAALIVVLFLMIVGSNLFQPASWDKDFQVHLGLDLTSGTTVTLTAKTPKGGTPKATEMKQALQIMQSRVYGAGFTEAQIQQQGNDVITVSVPGAAISEGGGPGRADRPAALPPGAAGGAEHRRGRGDAVAQRLGVRHPVAQR